MVVNNIKVVFISNIIIGVFLLNRKLVLLLILLKNSFVEFFFFINIMNLLIVQEVSIGDEMKVLLIYGGICNVKDGFLVVNMVVLGGDGEDGEY